MRRTDHDGHAARQGPPPFRVLAVPDVVYLSPSAAATTTTATTTTMPPPPPPRAPEPYKIAPSTTSFGRAHRRSSFVILAESSPASPEPGDAGSPTLPTGRVSPFRGRGFKGPPPHSMSRPQTPEIAEDTGRRRGRLDRRVSVSQQSSPRRSLIPQPTYRQRSTSLTKSNDRLTSPKIGRRVESKTRLNESRTRLNRSESRSRANLAEPKTRFISNSTSNLSASTAHRQPTKASTRLSPIQGTPTKPERTTPRTPRGAKTSPSKTPRASPRKNTGDTRKSNQNRNTSKERVTSPSKIPLKKSGSGSLTSSSGTSGRFISMTEQSSKKVDKSDDRFIKEDKSDKPKVCQNGQSTGDTGNVNGIEMNSSSPGKSDDVDLIDLLKQSSSHVTTGTSSERLVNTTTTTAVQPLHIDANTLLADGPVASQERPEAPGSKDASPLPIPAQNSSTPASGQKSALPSSSDQSSRSSNFGSDKKDSPVGAESTGGHSKSSSMGQLAKNVARTNGEGSARQARSGNQSSANQRSGRNGQASRGPKPTDNGKTPDVDPEMTSITMMTTTTTTTTTTATVSAESKNGSASRTVGSREISANDKMPTVMENDSRIEVEVIEAAEMKIGTMGNAARNGNANPAIGMVNASANSGAVRTRNENRGSNASLKSSTGVSTDSIESVRSTDTGVSVNTVRGVSSPREKTGVHVVKRPQEIETLSGNVVRVEQNGEPALLTSSDEKQGDSQKPLARWKRSLSRYAKCYPGMRCLACRRDPKGLLWTRNQERPTVVSDSLPPVAAAAALNAPPPPAATSALQSRWAKLRTRCRCARLREIKCCARRSRVAPAESTPCCPPERRFGALCRRVFGRCSCKRADTQQRTRNVRAKHSLTSVAPPPVSEEPKAKLPDVLVEHNSVMRGAIPCLPVPLAWFCLVLNVLLPGTGTVWSGLFNLCTGQPRFSSVAGAKSRLGALIVNLVVGVGQLFTVLFCLVGWGWSIWWGVTMVRLARKYKRFKDSEAASNDPEARGGGPAAQPPDVPSQALRGMERAR